MILTISGSDGALVRSEQHSTYVRTNVMLTLDEIARLSESLDLTRRSIESRLQDIEDASRFMLSRFGGELHGMRRAQEQQAQFTWESFSILRASQDNQAQHEARARQLSIVFPACVISAALILANSAYVSTDNSLRVYTPWLALWVVFIHNLRQATLIPRTIGYGVENSIIFVDFVGASMKMPPELCGTMDVRFMFYITPSAV